MLSVRDIAKSYGPVAVLKGVTFDIAERHSLAVIGPNGAGKTTLMKVVTGEVFAEGGNVAFAGGDVTRQPAHLRVRAGIGRTFQVSRVFLENSVLDNAVIAVEARLRNESTDAPWHEIRPSAAVREEAGARLDAMGLGDKRATRAAFLSHGDRKRLELALALALNPRLLVLDEPTAGMSPPERRRTVELIAGLRASHGLTLLLTEHDMGVVFDLADQLMVLNYGAVIARGTAEEIRADPEVRKVYLGREMVHAQGR